MDIMAWLSTVCYVQHSSITPVPLISSEREPHRIVPPPPPLRPITPMKHPSTQLETHRDVSLTVLSRKSGGQALHRGIDPPLPP